uniref:Zinc finger ZPR1-type domain-containing protein n=1 Tax=Esox lucius TaxID=8010 RepID=A0AAY5L5K8_ESOLU
MSLITEGNVRGGSVFKEISADDEDNQTTEIESLCMNCYQNGLTRFLLTKIPFFKEIIVSSFSCPNCSWSNTEIQSAGRIQDQGIIYTLKVKSKQDMNREIVKVDSATTRIPELDFEIPPYTQKGSLSTIEGLLDRAVAGLKQDQPLRKVSVPEVAEKIDGFIDELNKLKDGEREFTLIIDDPSGNSFVENPFAPQKDESLSISHYKRTPQQDAQLGIKAEEEDEEEEKPSNDIDSMRNEVLTFNTNCPECNAPASTNMKLVKSGGATEELGTRITLHITDVSDMSRDLLKSETCSILIPELEFELGMAAVGGKFTTLEGLLKDIKDLIVSKNPFTCGDSSTSDRTEKLKLFGQKIDQIMAGEMDVHIVLDDPAGNSYLQNVYAPDPDPEMTTEKYTRTFEQNEDLGLNDMKTEDYQ